jgi:hypothetical protein
MASERDPRVSEAAVDCLAVFAPAAALTALLKLLRIIGYPVKVPVWELPVLVLPEPLLYLGAALLSTALLSGIPPGKPRAAVRALVLLSAAALVAVEVIGFVVFKRTGWPLDSGLVALALTRFEVFLRIVNLERTVLLAVTAAAGFVLAFGAPGFIHSRIRPEIERLLGRVQPALFRKRLAVVAAAICLAGSVLLPRISGLGRAFAADHAVYLAHSILTAEPDPIAPESLHESGVSERLAGEDRERPNVVLVVLEGFRHDATTPYNPKRETTPFLAKLAKTSLLAERHYAVIPHTSKSLVAMFCGITPDINVEITEAAYRGIPARCLPDLLRDRGYRTALFQPVTKLFENRRALAAEFGFEHFIGLEDLSVDGFDIANYLAYEDRILIQPSLNWLRKDKKKPFFLSFVTGATHAFYRPVGRYPKQRFVEDEDFNRYLNSVRYLDGFLKELLQELESEGLRENTIIVVVGDHGQAFHEHGQWGHGYVIYEEGLRVPLLIHDPRDPRERRVKPLSNHLDLFPTLVEKLGFESNRERPGKSLLALEPDRTLFAHCLNPLHCGAVIGSTGKFVHFYGSKPDRFFELGMDEGEVRDRLPTFGKEFAARKLSRLLTWKERVRARYSRHRSKSAATPPRTDAYATLIPLKERPQPAIAREIDFGGKLKLLGFELSKDTIGPEDAFAVTYFFERTLAAETFGINSFLFTGGKTYPRSQNVRVEEDSLRYFSLRQDFWLETGSREKRKQLIGNPELRTESNLALRVFDGKGHFLAANPAVPLRNGAVPLHRLPRPGPGGTR